jgi:hypothetical protein
MKIPAQVVPVGELVSHHHRVRSFLGQEVGVAQTLLQLGRKEPALNVFEVDEEELSMMVFSTRLLTPRAWSVCLTMSRTLLFLFFF